MLEMVREALPVFWSSTLWAPLAVPTVCEMNVRLVGERVKLGAGGGDEPPPPPPPQATTIIVTSNAVAYSQLAEHRRAEAWQDNAAKASSPARSQGHPASG